MAYGAVLPLDEVVYFEVDTHSPTTGADIAADSTPTFAVYEEATDSDIGVGGNLTVRTGPTGSYRGTFTASAANGFELGKWYNVRATAVVGGITASCTPMTFRVIAAELVAGYPLADVAKWLGGTIPAVNTTGVPKVDATLINGATSANLAKTVPAIGRGTVTSGSSTTSVTTSVFTPTGAVANQFAGRVVLFDADTTTATLRGVASAISASSNAAAPTFTVATLPATPASGDTFSVI